MYALPYFAPKARPVLLLCLTIPGNTYPVVEDRDADDSLLGAAIKSGYQSNYVLTTKDGKPITANTTKEEPVYDELVLDQEAQVVPYAMIEFDQNRLADAAKRFTRAIPNSQ